jgi:cell wall-associated NlpC family hydrolase
MATGAELLAAAQTQLGKPYVFGAGLTPDASGAPPSFDCSSFMKWVYSTVGLTIPRVTFDQVAASNATPIDLGDLAPGDLIFSDWGAGGPNSHVAMYAGDGRVIEDGDPKVGVTYTPFDDFYRNHVTAYRRVTGVDGSPTPGGGILSAVGNTARAVAGWIPTPGNLTEALTNVGTGIQSVAESAAGVGRVANMVSRAFLPTNIIRGFCFLFGMIFILIGIWFLGREVRQ